MEIHKGYLFAGQIYAINPNTPGVYKYSVAHIGLSLKITNKLDWRMFNRIEGPILYKKIPCSINGHFFCVGVPLLSFIKIR